MRERYSRVEKVGSYPFLPVGFEVTVNHLPNPDGSAPSLGPRSSLPARVEIVSFVFLSSLFLLP